MTQLQTFDDTQKLIQKYGTRDPFELIDALPNTKLWPARSLDADGLRGFATIVNRVRYIAVNPHLPYEEQRVIAGHELGHIFEHSPHFYFRHKLYIVFKNMPCELLEFSSHGVFLPTSYSEKCIKPSIFRDFLHSLQWFDPRKFPRYFQA